MSSTRLHPLNFVLYSTLINLLISLLGFSPEAFFFLVPFNMLFSFMVHANLNWTFGPLRAVLASPVFHRWHHARSVCDANFASTFPVWDVMFGTYHMPVGELPKDYGIDDAEMPEGLVPQLLYPLIQRDVKAIPAVQSGA